MLTLDKKLKAKKIPPYLIYDEIDGRILPYKGYLEVLKGKKKIEDIMGNSSLQAFLVTFITNYIFNNINRKKYITVTNEAGLHIGEGNNLANDIAIYEKESVVLDDKYFTIAPKIVIEIDIKIELSLTEWTNEWDYVIAKSKKMIEFGTDKIIWITTKSKKIFVSSSTERWYMVDFNEDIPIIDGCILNLENLIKDEDLVF